MRPIKPLELSRTAKWIGIAITVAAITFLTYPLLVAEAVGKKMPPGWSPQLGEMTFAEIYKEIGPPQHDMSAKEYQSWVESHWWGSKILKIASDDCCGPTDRPSHVQYLVYVNGRAKPALNEFIFETSKR